MTEEWRPVVDFEGWYEVSNLGRVKRLVGARSTRAGRILVGSINGRGYPIVSLHVSGRRTDKAVHQLVAAAFLGPRPSGTEINHIDSDRASAAASNLEYVTHQQNIAHAGRRMARVGAGHPMAKLSEQDVISIRSHKKGSRSLAAQYGISYATMSDIRSGRRWAHVV